MVANDNGGHRREVLLVEAENFFVPALLAGTSVKRYEVIVGRDEVQIVAPHPDTAIADVCAPSRLPEVMPQLVPVASIERPCVVGCGDVECAVDLEHCTLDLGGAGGNDVARTLSTNDQWRSTRTGSVRQVPGPRQREVLDVGLVDLNQRAIPPAAVVARIRRPRI